MLYSFGFFFALLHAMIYKAYNELNSQDGLILQFFWRWHMFYPITVEYELLGNWER